MLGVFRVQTETKYVLLIHIQVKISENGRKNIFRDKQTTNKVPLMLLDVKVLPER